MEEFLFSFLCLFSFYIFFVITRCFIMFVIKSILFTGFLVICFDNIEKDPNPNSCENSSSVSSSLTLSRDHL